MKVSINQLLSTNFSKDKQLEARILQRDNCLVGWVDSYNNTNNTVNIQPAIQSEIMSANQTTQLKNKPFLINCHIISNTLNRIPQRGDKALVFVLDEKSNNFFKASYNSNKPLEQQTFVNQSKAYKTLSNCVAFIINPNPVTGGGGESSLTSLSFKPSNGELVYNKGVATASGNFIYTTTESETPVSITGSIQTNIVGNGGVIVDADETNSTLEIHLDDTVLTTDSQTFTEEQQAQARQNIGAGTSNFSGSYDDLSNLPTFTVNSQTVDNINIYAPTTSGTSGQVLQSNGANQAPSWVNISSGGTTVNVNNVPQTTIDFTSDPQTQINNIISGNNKINNAVYQEDESLNSFGYLDFGTFILQWGSLTSTANDNTVNFPIPFRTACLQGVICLYNNVEISYTCNFNIIDRTKFNARKVGSNNKSMRWFAIGY